LQFVTTETTKSWVYVSQEISSWLHLTRCYSKQVSL